MNSIEQSYSQRARIGIGRFLTHPSSFRRLRSHWPALQFRMRPARRAARQNATRQVDHWKCAPKNNSPATRAGGVGESKKYGRGTVRLGGLEGDRNDARPAKTIDKKKASRKGKDHASKLKSPL